MSIVPRNDTALNRIQIINISATNQKDTQLSIYALPESFSENYTATFETQSTWGRSTPYYGYSGGSGKTVELTIELNLGSIGKFVSFGSNPGLPENDTLDKSIDLYDRVVSFMQALNYPTYTASETTSGITAPACLLSIGNMLGFSGACTSCSISRELPVIQGRYVGLKFTLSFIKIVRQAESSADIFKRVKIY